jgi:Transposase DDE domain
MTTQLATGTRFDGRRAQARVEAQTVETFVDGVLGETLHEMRVKSLALATVGVLHSASLAIHMIGRGLAAARGTSAKHGTKQVDRLLSNGGIELWRLLELWVRFVVGVRKEIIVALDWTEFDADKQATICLYMITRHGRATPLIWKTVSKKTLAGKRNEYEYDVVGHLHEALPPDVKITLLADRGFGDQKMYAFLDTFGWDYVIRFRECIHVTDANGTTKPAADWLDSTGRAKMLKGVGVTDDKAAVPAVVVVHDKRMKESWCLVTSRVQDGAAAVVKLYGRRFTIEETFRDTKDVHFGMGLSATHIGSNARRDRLLFLGALAYALLVLLGAAGERCELDRTLKASTTKRRTLSLFKQGCFWYDAIPAMRDDRFENLMMAYDACVREHAVFAEAFGLL